MEQSEHKSYCEFTPTPIDVGACKLLIGVGVNSDIQFSFRQRRIRPRQKDWRMRREVWRKRFLADAPIGASLNCVLVKDVKKATNIYNRNIP